MKSGPLERGRRRTAWAMAQSCSRSVCILVTVFVSWAITVSKIIKNLATDFETFRTYIAGYDRKVVWSLIPGYLLISQFIALFLYYFAKNTLAPSRCSHIPLTNNAAFFTLRLPYSYAIEILTSCVLSDVVSNLVDVCVLMVSARKLPLVFILLRCTKWAMKYSCPKAVVFGRLT
jgi:hypothetical protein